MCNKICPFLSKSTGQSVEIHKLIFELTEKIVSDVILFERGTKHILKNLVIFPLCKRNALGVVVANGMT